MKQNIPIIYMTTITVQRVRTAVLAAFLMLVGLLPVGCADKLDIQSPPDPTRPTAGAPVHFTVTDGGYVSASPETRTVDVGYTTRFVKGDTIGLCIVTERSGYQWRTQSNIPLIFNGTEWEVDPNRLNNADIDYISTDSIQIHYFVYSPYQRSGAIASSYSRTATAREFFKKGIDSWVLRLDQSTQDAYAASDLMVAKGEVTPRTDGDGYTVNFRMEHQMALAVVNVPRREYTYKVGIAVRNYQHYRGLSLDNGGAFLMDDLCTGRYLMRPGARCDASYYDSDFKKRSFTIATSTDNVGSYVRYFVDNADEPVSPIPRELCVGDLYMHDGGILPLEFVQGTSVGFFYGQCLGIVCSIKDPTLTDPLLRRHHPTCNHGTVIALTDVYSNPIPWSLTEDNVDKWTSSTDRGENRVRVRYKNNPSLQELGYSHTYALRLYNEAHPNKKVLPIIYIDKYIPAAPRKSSGWYWPAAELFSMPPLSKMNGFFILADGKPMSSDLGYWLSIEYDDFKAWNVLTSSKTEEALRKKDSRYIRAFLAF